MMGSHEDEYIRLWKTYMQSQSREKGRPAGAGTFKGWILSEEGEETEQKQSEVEQVTRRQQVLSA